MAKLMQDVWRKYREFLIQHPEKMGQIESVISASSYITPGSSNLASVISELISAGSSLLTLLNDAILRQEAKIELKVPVSEHQLRTWLSVVDCVEVLVEITAMTSPHSPTRWLVVVVIQIIKATIRFLLMLKHNAGIYVATPTLKRDEQLKEKLLANSELVPEETQSMLNTAPDPPKVSSDPATFCLERSGRVVRSLTATPPYNQRTWKPPVEEGKEPQPHTPDSSSRPTVLNKNQKIAESLHILRPLIHLLSMYKCGQASWKPWLLACGVDITSLCVMGQPKPFNENERSELSRRTMIMLLYFLRSPFYDQFSRAKIFFLLNVLGQRLPGGKMVSGALLDYLPWWQQVYAYVWMS